MIHRYTGTSGLCAVGILIAAAAQAMAVYPAPTVGLATSMDKVIITGGHLGFPFEGWYADSIDLYLARREHEAFQVVVIPDRNLTSATVTVSTLTTTGGTPLDGSTQVSLVGHVNTTNCCVSVFYPAYMSGYCGWWPDALLTFKQSCSINTGDRVAFWIDIAANPAAIPGTYTGTITVSAYDTQPRTIQLNVHVWDFELPFRNTMEMAFSSEALEVARIYGDLWGLEMRYKLYDLLLAHRVGPVELYRTSSPEPFDWIQHNANGGGNAFCLGKVPSISPSDLNNLVAQLKTASLFDMSFVYGYDEVGPDYFPQIAATFNAIHAQHPGLRTCTTARDFTFGTSPETSYLRDPVDIWCPPIDRFNAAEAVVLRSEGKNMWWYNCITPQHPYPNYFIEYPAIESRLLMGAMAYKYQPGGHLYWATAVWRNNSTPITSGPYTNWNPLSNDIAGDGSITLPGPTGPIPTLRLANIRDGIEDFEYLNVLMNTVAQVQQLPSTPETQAYITSANALLAVPTTIVNSRTSFTRVPTDLLNYRQQIAAAIAQGKAIINPPFAPGDFDQDGDVDLEDFGLFQRCLSESGAGPPAGQCAKADIDKNETVNSADTAKFRNCLTAPGVTASLSCAD